MSNRIFFILLGFIILFLVACGVFVYWFYSGTSGQLGAASGNPTIKPVRY